MIRIRFYAILFCITMVSSLKGQDEFSDVMNIENCGTPFSKEDQKAYFESLQRFRESVPNYRPTKTATIALSLHITHKNDGSGGVTEEEALIALERVNAHYKGAGIEFFVCEILHHNNSSLYDDKGDKKQHEKKTTLHVWFVNNAGGACGYASFPGGTDRCTVMNRCAITGTSFEHELGHNFGLAHTHGGGEWVARPGSGKPTNCDKKGDGFCDTPADPTLSGKVNSDCTIKGNLGKDSQGDTYVPDPYNVMAYSSKSCRSVFTKEQLAYMNWVANEHSDRNKFKCESIEPDFKVKSLLGCNGKIQFYDYTRATKTMKYKWSFEGGNPSTSTDENPVVKYDRPGEYEVELEVNNPFGTEKISRKIKVKKTEAISLPFKENFEDGSDALDAFEVKSGELADVLVHKDGGKEDNGLILDGGDKSIYHTKPTPEVAFITNPHFNSSAGLYCVDLSYVADPVLKFDYKLLFGTSKFNTNFRVLIDGKEVMYDRPNSTSDEEWRKKEIDLKEYVGEYVDIVFEGSSRYGYKDNNGNGVFVDNIEISGEPVGINEAEFLKNFSISPNPTQDNLSVKFDIKIGADYKIELRDMLGKIVYKETLNNFKGSYSKILDLSNIGNGVYSLSVFGKGFVASRKIIKN